MNNSLLRILSLFLCFVIGFLSACSQEDRTRGALRAFRQILHEATIQGDTPPLERLFKAKKVSRWFDEKAEVTLIDEDGDRNEQKRKLSREAIERHIVGAYRISRDIRYEVVSDGAYEEDEGVRVSALLRIYGNKPSASTSYLEELRVELLFKKGTGDWLIHNVMAERIRRN